MSNSGDRFKPANNGIKVNKRVLTANESENLVDHKSPNCLLTAERVFFNRVITGAILDDKINLHAHKNQNHK